MSLPGTSSTVASDRGCLSQPRTADGSNLLSDGKRREAAATVTACFNLLRNRTRARDIMTKQAFENAIVVMCVRCIAVPALWGLALRRGFEERGREWGLVGSLFEI